MLYYKNMDIKRVLVSSSLFASKGELIITLFAASFGGKKSFKLGNRSYCWNW